MRLIGLTGGIGSGKSSVSRVLAQAGAVIIDADAITHDLERRGQPVWCQIVHAFGYPVLTADGELDRKKLGRRIFSDVVERERLNAIVHPRVRQEIAKAIAQTQETGVKAAVLDVPLLIEGGLYRKVDQVWLVYAEPEQQVKRIAGRDRVGEDTAWQRIRAQMALSDKVAYADVVIDNRGRFQDTEEVVLRLWQNAVADA